MRQNRKSADLLVIGLLFVLVMVAFLARSPYAVPVPIRDSGIFLHIGSEVLEGKLLYQQTWDNKQPLLYWINAAGLWLGGGSVWGVWALELALLLLTVTLFYRVIRPALPPLAAFVILAVAFLAVFPFMGGNYSEEYSLVFQAGILAGLFGIYLPGRTRLARPLGALLIGALTGLVFLIKQTYLDVPITVLVFILFLAWVEQDRRIYLNLLLAGVGFALVNLPVFAYFWSRGALQDYVVNAFLFNRYYSYLTIMGRILSLIDKVKFVTSHPFFLVPTSLWLGGLILLVIRTQKVSSRLIAHPKTRRLAFFLTLLCFGVFFASRFMEDSGNLDMLQRLLLLAGGLFGGFSLFLFLHQYRPEAWQGVSAASVRADLRRQDWRSVGPAPLLFLGWLDLPIFLVTISLSGKPWTHYYVPIFPALVLVMAGSLAYLYRQEVLQPRRAVINTLLVALLVTGSFPPLYQVVTTLSEPGGEDARSQTAEYLQANTTPQDTILVWGWESVIYFLAGREAPTRFALPFALYVDTPYLSDYAATLLKEVQANPPAYFIDLQNPEMPFINSRPAETCLSGNQLSSPGMVAFLAYICEHYELDRGIDTINIYRLKPPQ